MLKSDGFSSYLCRNIKKNIELSSITVSNVKPADKIQVDQTERYVCLYLGHLVRSIGKLIYTKKSLKNLLRIRDNKAIVSVLLTSANSLKPLNGVN